MLNDNEIMRCSHNENVTGLSAALIPAQIMWFNKSWVTACLMEYKKNPPVENVVWQVTF